MRSENEILNDLPFGIVSVDDDRIIHANRLCRSLFENVPRTFSDLLDAFPELEALGNVGSEQEPVWLSIGSTNFCVVSTRQGHLVNYSFLPSWFVSATDRGIQKLQKNFDDFVEIFENCFDGIYVADGQGRTLWMNAGFERCYGLSARNFLGRDASKLEREGYLDPLITWKIISTKQRQTALQTTKSGRKVLATGIPLFDKDGSVRRVIINSRDATELIEIQGKLSAAEREIRSYETELRQIRESAGKDGEMSWFSEEMQDVVSLAMRVARTDASVCVSGPSGVGKRKLADLVFRYSKRARKRLLRIGFGDLPEDDLLRELFKSGSSARDESLLDRAAGGTLILERIDLMPPRVQERLSTWIRDREARMRSATPDVRLISTCQGDLGGLVSDGKFRQDLYFRLTVAKLSIPPLSARVSDTIGLAQQFLETFNTLHGTQKSFERAALQKLARWEWPGNVRELRTVIERLIVTEVTSQLSTEAVGNALDPTSTQDDRSARPRGNLSGDEIQVLVRAYEADLLKAQVANSGSIRKAANATGISLSTIKRKLAWARRYHAGQHDGTSADRGGGSPL